VGRLSQPHQVRHPGNLEAYNLCLLGRYHLNKRGQAALKQALDLFEQAAQSDPTYAPAHSGIADACGLLASYSVGPPMDMYARAAAAAEQAIALDESLAEGHASLGFAKYNWEWDWDGAERELRRAIALNPNYAQAHQWLAMFLAGIGRGDEAVPIARRAIDLDPLSINPNQTLGTVLVLAGRLDDAVQQFRRVIAMAPSSLFSHVWLALALALRRRGEESLAVAERIIQVFGATPIARMCLAAAYAASDRLDEARQIQDEVSVMSYAQPFQTAVNYAFMGDEAATFEWLERGVAVRTDMYALRVHPAFAALRGHPRFVQLIDRLGLHAKG